MTEPRVVAWKDQFAALLRDTCRQMLQVIALTDWNTLATILEDPYDEDRWRIEFNDGEFIVTNLNDPEKRRVILDLEELGVEL